MKHSLEAVGAGAGDGARDTGTGTGTSRPADAWSKATMPLVQLRRSAGVMVESFCGS